MVAKLRELIASGYQATPAKADEVLELPRALAGPFERLKRSSEPLREAGSRMKSAPDPKHCRDNSHSLHQRLLTSSITHAYLTGNGVRPWNHHAT
ncbi:hypothetical protein A5892_15325 [Halotalea alkalilenta]|uniref:Uncharacterized protein n=1 Tax=Halotalea alkalilenta TaxID=376489 RepID=A0A172YHK8_9GAMM|nr:hypothetical protein A5892_15325 [Halotalea alkalilenta]